VACVGAVASGPGLFYLRLCCGRHRCLL
jgi:hypothetical protein